MNNTMKKVTRSLIAVGVLATMTVSAMASEVYTTGNSWIRKSPNRTGKKIAVMPEDEFATFLNASKKDERGVRWYKIRYNGQTGWISSRYTIKMR